MCRTFYCRHAKTNLHGEKDRYMHTQSHSHIPTVGEVDAAQTVYLNPIERAYECVYK